MYKRSRCAASVPQTSHSELYQGKRTKPSPDRTAITSNNINNTALHVQWLVAVLCIDTLLMRNASIPELASRALCGIVPVFLSPHQKA